MHGLGNDFVVVDCRRQPLALDAAAIRQLGDRHFGIGFDQLLTIEVASDASCAWAYGIWNRDGTPSGQCGNGLRCVVRWLLRDGALGAGLTRLQSPSGPVMVEVDEHDEVRADMGEPQFDVARIPILSDVDATAVEPLGHTIDVAGRRIRVGAVSMGNPHALVEVEDVHLAPVDALGPQIGRSAAFPQGCNVGFAQIVARDAIRLRVWERGVGETLACGSGASAAMAILRQRGQVDDDVRVDLPGGSLRIQWPGPGQPLWMSGPAQFVFEGVCADPSKEGEP